LAHATIHPEWGGCPRSEGAMPPPSNKRARLMLTVRGSQAPGSARGGSGARKDAPDGLKMAGTHCRSRIADL
jgi:hypothetical protein